VRKSDNSFTLRENDDVFVHHCAIQADGLKFMCKGDRVSFDVAAGIKGPIAEQVRKL